MYAFVLRIILRIALFDDKIRQIPNPLLPYLVPTLFKLTIYPLLTSDSRDFYVLFPQIKVLLILG